MAGKPVLNADQKEALRAILKFLEHPSVNVFILKGYAGTGKTFLMQQLGTWLKKTEQPFCLLASTGRAASVLKGKTGFSAKTVHGELYHFSKLDGLGDELSNDVKSADSGQLSMQFLVRQADEEKILYIVDESSMLSSNVSAGTDFATFGSGVLLDDLFQVIGNNKVIFVGDPCQLPPVGQSFSPALDPNWLAGQDKVAITVTLHKIERTNAENDILKLAEEVREMISWGAWPLYLKLPASNLNNVKLYQSNNELFVKYLEKYKATGANETLAIVRSNQLVQTINFDMRAELFGAPGLPIQNGEVLLVTQNNYKVPLTNGDFVVIQELGGIEIRGSLKFQKVKVKALASGIEFELLLSLDSVQNLKGQLSADENKELMIDFTNRMRADDIKPNSAAYKKAMLEDPYVNCLKATYGYAVTCHKAQGGEWNNVFLFLDHKMYGMQPLELCKWWYTAITRAKKELNLVKDWWIA